MSGSARPALIVVDMQYDFVHGSLAVPGAPSIVEAVNELLKLPFIMKIGTKDYHPANHISFATTHGKPVFSKIMIHPPGEKGMDRGIEQVLWPVHCVASSPGSEFIAGLNHQVLDAVVLKGKDPAIETYSAFHDPWNVTATELHTLLREKDITDVIVVGLAGDFCVKCTALDAVDLGYRTWVVREAVRSVSDAGTEWDEMSKKGVEVVDRVADVEARFFP